MDLAELVGQTFQENHLFELLQFEIEENFEKYFGIFFHLDFENKDEGFIQVTSATYFNNEDEFFKIDKAKRKKESYFRIYDNFGHIDMELCQLNKTGKYACIRKDHTWVENFGSYYLEDQDRKPMTEDEIRQAFQELAELFNSQEHLQNSKTKKAI